MQSGSYVRSGTGEIRRIVNERSIRIGPDTADATAIRATNYILSRFDLLGSGWVDAVPGTNCRGFRGRRYDAPLTLPAINESNRSYSDRLRRELSDQHRPIDWQRDFRSGYRWDESLPSDQAQIGDVPGSDIKVPWELGKLQHLPQLAITYATGEQDPALVRAFRDQTIDFIAANPPGFGVQWATAMMAGIRIGNMLLAYDIFRAADVLFDEVFRDALYRSALDHARFILGSIEWWVDGQRNNHLLANIAGLAAVCAYLPRTPETDDILALVLRVLDSEIDEQFNRDGSGVEGSTAYHAFAAECVGWTVVFVESISLERREAVLGRRGATLPAFARRVGWSFIRSEDLSVVASPARSRGAELRAINSFLIDCLDGSDRLVQIGDNDSGRFVKLHPRNEILTVDEAISRYGSLEGYEPPDFMTAYLDEDLLAAGDVAALVGAVSGSPRFSDMATIDYRIAWDFLDASGDYRPAVEPRLDATRASFEQTLVHRATIDGDGAFRAARPIPGAEVRLRSYPQFGLYVYRAADFLLYVRCGGLLTLSTVGHPHDDQLSIDLAIGGEHVVQDPGTFVYTPAPVARELYRSRSAHFVPAWRPSDGRLRRPMFGGDPYFTAPVVQSVRHNRFEASVDLHGVSVTRAITIAEREIVIEDTDDTGRRIDLSEAFEKVRMLPPSAGYGKTMRAVATHEPVEA